MSSTYYTILQSVQTLLINNTNVSNVVIRRRLQLLQTDIATLPIIYVCPNLPAGEKVRLQTFSKVVCYQYPVTVCYVQAGASDMISGLDTFLQNAESIRQQLFQPNLAGTQTWDIAFDPDATSRFQEFIGANYDCFADKWLFTAQVEPRIS